jgi:hypothetical protein
VLNLFGGIRREINFDFSFCFQFFSPLHRLRSDGVPRFHVTIAGEVSQDYIYIGSGVMLV